MRIGTLVRIDPHCPISLECKEDDPDEYMRELKWLGVVVDTLVNQDMNLYMIQWGHMPHPTPEYGDYLEVLCE